MTKIKAFKAVVYNQKKIKSISKVVCPPYDVISPLQQKAYHNSDPHNFLHILLAKDIKGSNKYKRAAKIFKQWQSEKVLIREDKPAVYFYSQEYKVDGKKKTRYGFLALLRLGEKKSDVYAHENTRKAAKEDRFSLIKEVKANLSPIFIIFPDKKRIINQLSKKCPKSLKPFISVTDKETTNHKLWRLDSPELLTSIVDKMNKEDFFIADGHHRYEVACNYRDLMRQKLGSQIKDDRFNYLLAYFTNTDPEGLSIFPIHRLIKLSKSFELNLFLRDLNKYFKVIPVNGKKKLFTMLNKAGKGEHLFGMYYNKRYWLLALKDLKVLDRIISDKPVEYRRLDVSILHYLVISDILGFGLEDKESIVFSPHENDLIKKADGENEAVAFFLNPVKMEQIMSLSLKGEKMPPKSTYFYPKVLSGLVINKLE